jgi:hypothetical protein
MRPFHQIGPQSGACDYTWSVRALIALYLKGDSRKIVAASRPHSGVPPDGVRSVTATMKSLKFDFFAAGSYGVQTIAYNPLSPADISN